MNRGELSTEIQSRIDRSDSTAQDFIDDWINRVIRRIEDAYPFAYTKKSQTATLTSGTKSFALPTDLILHHPFTLLLEKTGTSSSPEYEYIVKVEENFFDQWFQAPNTTGDDVLYMKLTGGDDGVGFDVYPVPTANRTLKIASGHYYTGNWTSDSSSNWLSVNHPDVIMEGVCAIAFDHYDEPDKAANAKAMFQAYMQGDPASSIMGLIPAQHKMDRKGRITRVKTWSDMPAGLARKKKLYGF